MYSLVAVLEKTVSPDTAELQQSLQFLQQEAQRDWAGLLVNLSNVLRDSTNTPVARYQAGLQLKNMLRSDEPLVKAEYEQRWLQLTAEIRETIKQNVLGALGTESMRPSAAAQAVAIIACVELPHQMWPNLLPLLTEKITDMNAEADLRQVCLEAIGYVCQDIELHVLVQQTNAILTAIIFGMRREEPNVRIRYAATTAFLNSLDLFKVNFANEQERNHIMSVVCETTQAQDPRIRNAALECLVKIMSIYYIYMESYMKVALFPITVSAMKEGTPEVALQGIEFWSTVCDEELSLAIELAEAQETGTTPERVSKYYAKGALPHICPILLEKLCTQEEHDDEDDWTPAKAASVCLMLMANCCEDSVLPHVLPFVEQHILCRDDWRMREAACMAFGCVLEGPPLGTLLPYVRTVFPLLVNHLRDESTQVRDTAAWAIGRSVESFPSVAFENQTVLAQLMESLLIGLNAEVNVAANVCWALASICEGAYESVAAEHPAGTEPPTYPLSPFFNQLVERLLATTDRQDASQGNLRNAAYDALMELVKNSPTDCYIGVRVVVETIMQRLDYILRMEEQQAAGAVNGAHVPTDRAQLNDIESLLCATLTNGIRKLSQDDVPHVSDQIMSALLRICQSNQSAAVQEDALMAICSLTEVMGKSFEKYMAALKPVLEAGLSNRTEADLLNAAIGVVDDLCTSMGESLAPYCDHLMPLLLNILKDPAVDKKVKPPVLSCFGTMAFAMGPARFGQHIDVSLQVLRDASRVEVDKNDLDMVDYLNDLRENCLSAYTGILQGLKGDDSKVEPGYLGALQPYVPDWLHLLEVIHKDKDTTDGVLAAACGLIGDLASIFGGSLVPLLEHEQIAGLISKGRRRSGKVKSMALWAAKEIKKARAAAPTPLQ